MLLPLLRAALCTAALLALSSLLVLLTTFLILRRSLARQRPRQRTRLLSALGLADGPTRRIVGFFHPYCNAGGGGERVLWAALACMQREEKDAVFVVYTGDVGDKGEKGRVSKDEILDKVANRFGIRLSPSTLHFVPLRKRFLVEDSTWPRFTLIGQSLGSVVLAYEGLGGREGVVPDVWIDTMGYAFAYPLVRYLCRIPVGSYTHYPTISTDMLQRVRLRQAGHTNPSHVARSWVLSSLKLLYYSLFASAYSWSLARADVVMVNSTWTKRHIDTLLGSSSANVDEEDPVSASSPSSTADAATSKSSAKSELRQRRAPEASTAPSSTSTLTSSAPAPRRRRSRPLTATTVYPPCDTSSLSSLPLSTAQRTSSNNERRITLFSLAQFRPEKEHPTQLRALARLFEAHPEWKGRVRLVCAGSVRGREDERRVERLRVLAGEMGLVVGGAGEEGEADVTFEVNSPWERLVELMGSASVGLHTMVDEHFGIGVVEFQAAGLIPLAHASAGPLLDIVVPYPPSSSTSSASSSSSSPSLPPGPTGFLAPPPSPSLSASPVPTLPLHQAFAEQLHRILSLPASEQDAIRARARRNAQERFGVEVFEAGWRGAWEELVGCEGRQ
ncbi:hypothetical protein JCM6882_005863 [Rhodosporidiobolus microsporus]